MKLAVIPGDGIGIEVTAQALHVLHAVLPGVDETTFDLGAARWHRTGEVLPDSALAEIRQSDAILLGAVGDPSVPSGVLERGLLLRLRFELDHYVNLRPAKLYPGVATALAGQPSIDFIVYREGTEGPYYAISTDNLFGNTITDPAAAISGGIAFAERGTLTRRTAIRRCSSRCTG